MCYADKRKTTQDERKGTTKSRKNQNARKKKKTYKYLGILEADIIKQVEMEKKIKRSTSGEREVTWSQTIKQKSYKRDKYLGYHPHKIPGTIF